MDRRPLIAALAALALVPGLLAGCVGARPEAGPQPAPPAPVEQTATAEPTAAAAPVRVQMTTSKGVIDLELYPAKAPKTVANFVKLAENGFYDGQRVHRVEPGFVVQAGDPLTKGLSAKELLATLERAAARAPEAGDRPIGTGGPGWSIPLETSDLVHDRGVIAMARSQDPDSAGSQFYITLGAAHQLDGAYAVFGKVTAGMDVVDSLAVGDLIRSVRIVGD